MPPVFSGRAPRGIWMTLLVALLRTRTGRSFATVLGVATLDGAGVLRLPDLSRPMALVLVFCGAVLALRCAAQRSLGYTRRATPRGRHLRRAIWAEAVLAGYLLLSGWIMRLDPNAPLECLLAVVGHAALLYIGGVIVADAAALGLPSVSAALLSSPAATGARRALSSWRRSAAAPAAPGVESSLEVLHATVPSRRASAVMVVLATSLATVAIANAGAAVREVTALVAHDRETAPALRHGAGEQRAASIPPARGERPPASSAHDRWPPFLDTYAARCVDGLEPGTGAPEPYASRLRELWLGGSSTDGVGATVAGCAERAREVRHTGLWYVVGRCPGGELQSVGVADRGGAAALLLHDAAGFILGKAAGGSLRGASRRTPMGAGDFHLVQTTAGVYVLARARVVGRSIPPPRSGCAPSAAPGEKYTVIPPGLVPFWVSESERGWLWPEQVGVEAGGRRHFVFRRGGGTDVVATAVCVSDQSCVMSRDGAAIPPAQQPPLTADALAAMRP